MALLSVATALVGQSFMASQAFRLSIMPWAKGSWFMSLSPTCIQMGIPPQLSSCSWVMLPVMVISLPRR